MKPPPIPSLHSDEAAADFVAEADLTAYDLSALKPVRFEFEKKDAQVNLRMSRNLLAKVKSQAKLAAYPISDLFAKPLKTRYVNDYFSGWYSPSFSQVR